jgi:hypothetical protein
MDWIAVEWTNMDMCSASSVIHDIKIYQTVVLARNAFTYKFQTKDITKVCRYVDRWIDGCFGGQITQS